MLDVEKLIDMVVDLKCFEVDCENTEENKKIIEEKEKEILNYLRGAI